MAKGLVTVFGANGFLGRFVLRALVKDGWRIRAAVRRPHTAQDLRVIGGVGQIQIVQANLRFQSSVRSALEGVDAVINLVGIPYKKGKQTFGAVHELGPKTIARASKELGITNVVHLSALGASEEVPSEYLSSKARGERAVQELVPSADIMRPAVMFGEGDKLFTLAARLVPLSPIVPLFGGGKTRLQPVYVGDVAQAIAISIGRGTNGKTYALAGPTSYTAKQLWQFTLASIDKKRVLLPMPMFMGKIMGFALEFWGAIPLVNLLIKPVITRDMVKALKQDFVPADTMPGLSELGITPETIEAIVPPTLETFKKYGQFHIQSAE